MLYINDINLPGLQACIGFSFHISFRIPLGSWNTSKIRGIHHITGNNCNRGRLLPWLASGLCVGICPNITRHALDNWSLGLFTRISTDPTIQCKPLRRWAFIVLVDRFGGFIFKCCLTSKPNQFETSWRKKNKAVSEPLTPSRSCNKSLVVIMFLPNICYIHREHSWVPYLLSFNLKGFESGHLWTSLSLTSF